MTLSPGLRMNVMRYTASLKDLVDAGRFEDTTAVPDEIMRTRGIEPDRRHAQRS